MSVYVYCMVYLYECILCILSMSVFMCTCVFVLYMMCMFCVDVHVYIHWCMSMQFSRLAIQGPA